MLPNLCQKLTPRKHALFDEQLRELVGLGQVGEVHVIRIAANSIRVFRTFEYFV